MDNKLICNRLSDLLRVVFVIAIFALFTGCSQSYYRPMSYVSDDMYSSHNRDEIIKQQQAQQVARAAQEEQRKAYWAQELGLNNQATVTTASYGQSQTQGGEYSDSPYSEKLAALSMNGEYERPSSYYEMQTNNSALESLAKYDPAKYDAYIDEYGTVIVEPKYVSSMYGTWGDSYYNNYAWNYGYPSLYYYSTWGYPRYSWWDYNYRFNYGRYGYTPYFSYGWRDPFYHYHWYRPSYGTSNRPPRRIVNTPSQSRPSSSYGGGRGTTTRGGSNVGRTNGSTYNRGGSTYNRGGTTYNRGGSSRSSQPYMSQPTRSQSSFGGSSRPSMSSPSHGGGGGMSGGTNRLGR